MRIYLASSWRNQEQPGMVAFLRERGHKVYDFRNPDANPGGFHWSEIGEGWRSWSTGEYLEALKHPIAEKGFSADMSALEWCNACVLLMPSGRSAAIEAGWAKGSGRLTICYFPPLCEFEPELMLKICDDVTNDLERVCRILDRADRLLAP